MKGKKKIHIFGSNIILQQLPTSNGTNISVLVTGPVHLYAETGVGDGRKTEKELLLVSALDLEGCIYHLEREEH